MAAMPCPADQWSRYRFSAGLVPGVRQATALSPHAFNATRFLLVRAAQRLWRGVIACVRIAYAVWLQLCAPHAIRGCQIKVRVIGLSPAR
jgi:hypothetical protein